MFLFFNNRVGCLGSLAISVLVTLLIFVACQAFRGVSH
jgi:hypothetical protein